MGKLINEATNSQQAREIAVDMLGKDSEEIYIEKRNDKFFAYEIIDVDSKIVEFVEKILKRIDKSFEIESSITEEEIKIEIKGEDANLLVGRDAEILNSLQYITVLTTKKYPYYTKKIQIDCKKYRERREKYIKSLCEKVVEKVEVTNKPCNLEPMPSSERKQVHTYLQNSEVVDTISQGKYPQRYVVVLPKGTQIEDFNNSSFSNFKRDGYKRKKSFGREKRKFY